MRDKAKRSDLDVAAAAVTQQSVYSAALSSLPHAAELTACLCKTVQVPASAVTFALLFNPKISVFIWVGGKYVAIQIWHLC